MGFITSMPVAISKAYISHSDRNFSTSKGQMGTDLVIMQFHRKFKLLPIELGEKISEILEFSDLDH